ncbi:Endonuclease/Exonuclease/phosphatase family protein [Sinomicrobium oceani]|uniref:Endonuclease/Exonuclease/phosphatase family protein n=2 Tax=Sinomicrobium oceani TaxID=1150368 RepID=A0A1K1N5B7_9FLAO|nr:Endonuclease/Exonuclease/phosphatase family protein [Sinomicrobium oceani]
MIDFFYSPETPLKHCTSDTFIRNIFLNYHILLLSFTGKTHLIMFKIILFFVVFVLFPVRKIQAQTRYTVKTVAFYNTENLFDTIPDSEWDAERSPEGSYRWTSERYRDKLSRVAHVISGIGADITGTAPDIVGLAEVENGNVLHDLVSTDNLAPYHYGIVHFDSPDRRGIDVALLYKKDCFTPLSSRNVPLEIYDEESSRIYTRDQLLVSGILDDEPVYFIVNHWPSRYGGERKSRPNRMAAAALNKKIIDSVIALTPDAKIISMGDLNDDPTDPSLKKVLKTRKERRGRDESTLYNPMEEMAEKGLGTLAHRDQWHLFDQIFFTSSLLKKDKSSYRYWKAGIYNKHFLITPSGPYRGYPLRSYTNGNYSGGYSDHFPVYIYLVKQIP